MTARLDPDRVARILRAVVDAEKPDLVIMGKQAVDGDEQPSGPDPGRLVGLATGHLPGQHPPGR